MIEGYTLTEEQLEFTGTPKEAVTLALTDPDRHPVLCLINGGLITFFVLHKNKGIQRYTDNETAILIRAFSTDFHHQGKGYAKQALQLLPNFVRKEFPEVTEIVLAVNRQNVPAQGLYQKCGYADTGVRVIGRKGEQFVMSSPL